MRRAVVTRSFTLLETIAALALLALLGVSILQVQVAVVRQTRLTAQRERVAGLVQDLLWEWRIARVPVTLPATGSWSDELRWERSAQPARIAVDVIPTEVRMAVFRREQEEWLEVASWSWLVPDPRPGDDR